MARKLTPIQKTFVEARGKGINRDQSAILATGTDENASRLEASPTVQQELSRIRAETIVNCGVTKEDVVQMLMDAGTMAKAMADPTGLVARDVGPRI